MAYGLQLYKSNGTIIFDSSQQPGGCVVDVVTATSTTQIKNYSLFAGRTAEVIRTSGIGNEVTISYSSGYPTITFPAYFDSTSPQIWVVLMI